MELKIDVEVGDYMSREDLEEEIKYAVKEYVAREVDEYFEIHSYRDFIGKTASDVFWRSIEEMGEDTHGAIRNAVRKTIVRLQPYQLIGKVHDFNTGKYELTHVQRVIDEEADEIVDIAVKRVYDSIIRRKPFREACKKMDIIFDGIGGDSDD